MSRTFATIRDLPLKEHRTWVIIISCVAFFGYAGSLGTQLAMGRGLVRGNAFEVVVLVACLAAFYAGLRHQIRAATWLLVGSVWLELIWSLFQVDDYGMSPMLFGFAPLVVGVGLLMGIRASLFMAAATGVGVIAAPLLGEALGVGLGLRGSDALGMVVFEVSLVAVVALLAVFLRTFSVVLAGEKRHAQKTAELLEGAPDAIVALDPVGRIEAFNSAAERLFAVSRTEVLGRSVKELPLILENDPRGGDVVGATAFDALKGTGPTLLSVVGRDLSVEALARHVTRSDGSKGTLLVLRDITERMRAEKRARELQRQLERAQRMEAVGVLAGGVAHDVNNLLTVVGGYASLLVYSSDPDAQKMASELVAVQERGAALTRQLLAFSRQDVSQPRTVDLAALVRRMEGFLRHLVGDRVTLTIDAEEQCPVFIDPARFEQVVLNLAANARDAMPGGGEVSITCRNGSEDGQEEVFFDVRDHGIGMDPQTVERIFEPFFTLKPRGEGTGLGLSTVRGIVNEAGGQINVETAPDCGATFRIIWPRSEQSEEQEQPPIERLPTRERTGTILLVEDDANARTFIRRVLQHTGFTVVEAASADEALIVADQGGVDFDLLLTDVVMPGMNGVELTNELRSREPKLPTLLMSGYLDDVLGDPSFDPTEDLILKPFTGEQLLHRIDAKLESSVESEEGSKRGTSS